MDDERREDLELVAKDGQAVHSTINSVGWKKIIEPALVARKEQLMEQLCICEVVDFVKIQQSVNAIDSLMMFINHTLLEGKGALEELRPQNTQ